MPNKKGPIKVSPKGSGKKGTTSSEISKRLLAVQEGRLGPKGFMNFLVRRGFKIGKD